MLDSKGEKGAEEEEREEERCGGLRLDGPEGECDARAGFDSVLCLLVACVRNVDAATEGRVAPSARALASRLAWRLASCSDLSAERENEPRRGRPARRLLPRDCRGTSGACAGTKTNTR